MIDLYLITGAVGHLGSALARVLVGAGKSVRGFDREGCGPVPEGVEMFFGDVTDPETLVDFLHKPGESTRLILIHCAGIVSISSRYDPRVYQVNVVGTQVVLNAAIEAGVDRFIYVSSVHAIPEKPHGNLIAEVDHFDPDQVIGGYAKTKAEASQYVIDRASQAGLEYVIVHPSGLMGPYDDGHGHISALIIDYYRGRLTSGVNGGYDFVDVRDVVQGIIAAAQCGRSGECYILSGRYYRVRELLDMVSAVTGRKPIRHFLPIWFVKATAPFSEIYYRLRKVPPLYTSYSIYTLESNANFTNEKAVRDLGYTVRPLEETLHDTVDWFRAEGLIV
ncbi:MAG: NAD-dependent epimerase/dehydratase family protein [Propionibacteriaceae bacterium]|jgi:dihydroflavonol-4-reductase|nr:NAD-dependent epimerase/dehydratase family protein [Propionibacteriaceae bacterium]